jgi:Zn-finger domain-containing protein
VKTDEFIKRENDKLRQFYEDKFKQELIMYHEKLGDFIQAHYHITMAESIDDFLKTFER